jgi:hypothetical protein
VLQPFSTLLSASCALWLPIEFDQWEASGRDLRESHIPQNSLCRVPAVSLVIHPPYNYLNILKI